MDTSVSLASTPESARADELATLRDSLQRFCEREYSFKDRQAILRHPQGFSRAHWSLFADLGWLGAWVDSDGEPAGSTLAEAVAITTAFGRALVIEPYLASAVLAAQLLGRYPERECARSLLGSIQAGTCVVTVAHAEPAARDGASHTFTRAARTGSGSFRLNGRKSFVLAGDAADCIIVPARTSGADGDVAGISLFIVRRDASGLKLDSFRTLDDARASDIALHDVEVPHDQVLSFENDSVGALDWALDRARLALCAQAVGAMDGAVSLTQSHLKTRRAYGAALSSFQALQHAWVDMLIELELSRSLLEATVTALFAADAATSARRIAEAKAFIGRSGRRVGAAAVQLHGAIGLADEYIVGHYFKKLTFTDVMLGDTRAQLARLADGPA